MACDLYKYESRFWSYIDVKDPNECWEYKRARNENGYGIFSIGYEIVRAHRVAMVFARRLPRLIPSHIHVLHNCDNPPCCNPGHLFFGDIPTNNRDMWNKGRAFTSFGKIGIAHHNAKLDPDKVRCIRLAAAFGISSRKLAKDYGMHYGTIDSVIAGETWKHVV